MQSIKPFHGSILCQAQIKSKNIPCKNGAYYEQDGKFLCGVHSKKNFRKDLPKDPNEKQKLGLERKDHHLRLVKNANIRKEKGEKGTVKCFKMKMMKDVPLHEDYLNVFPNFKHQNRCDGYGCKALSPMSLGPVEHKQLNLPVALNIENYHQFNKVWPSEVDEYNDPLKSFYETQRKGYNDPTPHRHKVSLEERKKLNASGNKNAPLYSIHQDVLGNERRFSYTESKYFYCTAYEKLAKETTEFKKLQDDLENGINLMICGYDAYEITTDLYSHYCDPSRPFGHDLVLATLLILKDPEEYPWRIYKRKHTNVYEGMI